MSKLTFSEYDQSVLTRLDKKERGYDEKSVTFYEYADKFVHKAISGTDTGVGLNALDNFRDGIQMFAGKRHAEKEYQKALQDFTRSTDVDKLGEYLKSTNSSSEFASRLNLTDTSYMGLGKNLKGMMDEMNTRISNPEDRIVRFKLANNSVKDTLDKGSITVITRDGTTKDISLKEHINLKRKDSSATTLQNYLEGYSRTRSKTERAVMRNATEISNYIKSDVNLSKAFSGKSSKDISMMIHEYKMHIPNNELSKLSKSIPNMDVLSVAKAIQSTKQVAELQNNLSKQRTKKRANMRKFLNKNAQDVEAMQGYNTLKQAKDAITTVISASNRFRENAAMRAYSRENRKVNSLQKKIDKVNKKDSPLTSKRNEKINRLENRRNLHEKRTIRNRGKLDRFQTKRNRKMNKKGNRLFKRESRIMKRKAARSIKRAANLAKIFKVLGIMLSIALIVAVPMIIIVSVSSFFMAITEGENSNEQEAVIGGITESVSEESRRDILCEELLKYNEAEEESKRLKNSALAGYAAYCLYVSNMGDVTYNYDDIADSWGILQWSSKKDIIEKAKKGLIDDLKKLNIDSTGIENNLYIESVIEQLQDSLFNDNDDVETISFDKERTKSIIKAQSLLCLYTLKTEYPDLYNKLLTYTENNEEEAVKSAREIVKSMSNKQWTEEELKKLDELATSIASDEIAIAFDVTIDFGDLRDSTVIKDVQTGRKFNIKISGKDITNEVVFKTNIKGQDDFNYTVTASVEGYYTAKNGQGTKVWDKDGNMLVDGYGKWKTIYANYNNSSEITIPTYFYKEKVSKLVYHEHTDVCEKELICKGHPHTKDCLEGYRIYNIKTHKTITVNTKDASKYIGSDYSKIPIYKCKYKDKVSHPHVSSCYKYTCDSTPKNKTGIQYTYVPYWINQKTGEKIVIPGSPVDGYGEIKHVIKANPNENTITFVAPAKLSTIIIWDE